MPFIEKGRLVCLRAMEVAARPRRGRERHDNMVARSWEVGEAREY